MTVKLIVLKSGEDIVADIKEMVVGEGDNAKVVGYVLTKPCAVSLDTKPLQVDEVIAALNALVASPFLAIGKPSTMVAAAELAPGMPKSTPANESPVVDEATTATQNITPR